MPDPSNDAGATASLWMATARIPLRPGLDEDLRCDACIVGAGIAGLSTAYHLAKAGKKVVVVDDGPLAGGETGRTTAHLTNAMDDRLYELERLHGAEGARLTAESHGAAIHRIEQIAAREGIDCDFERLDGYLFCPPGEPTVELERELRAAHRAGLTDVLMVSKAPIAGFDTGSALRFPNQAQFHPLRYLAGLSKAIERDGGRIFCGVHAERIEDGKDGRPGRVKTHKGPTVTADAIVVATNTPVNDLVTIHTKQAAYRTYVVGLRVPTGSVTKALYWDTLDPYHYVRLQGIPLGTAATGRPEYELLIVGGEDHKTGQAEDFDARFARLEAWARERFQGAQEVMFRWSGQVMEPVDALAFIGRNPGDENVYIATGDSGQGMTHGTIAGMLLTDLILGRPNPWATLYDPSRKSLRSLGEFTRENVNVAAQYRDLVTPGEVGSEDEIARGQGAVMRHGLGKLAVYRDEGGAVHKCSALCTHLKCVVRWNDAEKTWDCPCHGSRFDALGKVVNGPAIGPLAAVENIDAGIAAPGEAVGGR